jgi:hypothetical protein
VSLCVFRAPLQLIEHTAPGLSFASFSHVGARAPAQVLLTIGGVKHRGTEKKSIIITHQSPIANQRRSPNIVPTHRIGDTVIWGYWCQLLGDSTYPAQVFSASFPTPVFLLFSQ